MRRRIEGVTARYRRACPEGTGGNGMPMRPAPVLGIKSGKGDAPLFEPSSSELA